MKYKGEEKKIVFSALGFVRLIEIGLVTTLAFALALFPAILVVYFWFGIFDINNIFHLFIFCLILILDYHIFVMSAMFSTAFFINILRLKYEEGDFEKSINDKTAFKWFFYFTLYTPTYKLLNVVIIPPLKSLYLSMIGCKIGKNVYLAGDEWIIDPCVTEIGENTMIGGRTIITAHVAEDKLRIKKVKIGKNCLIGGDSLILPGVNTGNNVIVGSKTLVTKNKKLESGKTYIGIPAKEKV